MKRKVMLKMIIVTSKIVTQMEIMMRMEILALATIVIKKNYDQTNKIKRN